MLSIAIAMAVGASLLGFASVVGAQTSPPRFRELPKDGMTVRGPFAVLLRSPELADRVQKLGEHLRFNSTLPPRLNEFAILITTRASGDRSTSGTPTAPSPSGAASRSPSPTTWRTVGARQE